MKSLRCQRLKSKRGVTLVETLVTLAIIAILAFTFQQAFLTNWVAAEERLIRADFWQDANTVVENLTIDTRSAKSLTNTIGAGGEKQVDLIDFNDVIYATYRITVNGDLTIERPPIVPVTLATDVDFTNSNFDSTNSESLAVTLNFMKESFFRTITLDTATEIYLRNSP